jgi:DNA-binding response OmpR family regulator
MKILIVEDEKSLANALAHILKKQNYSVDISYEGLDGQYQAETGVYDIIILDRMLPGREGMDILKALRDEDIHTPVLMLTAKDSIQNRVEGLDAGADDYLIKPFSKEELLARLRALSRRHIDVVFNDEIKVGEIVFNPYKSEMSCGEQSVHLTMRESQLLEIFVKNRDLVLSKEKILEKVWGYDSDVELNNVEVYLSYLRRKLAKLDGGVIIYTVRGVGYCMKEV